MTVETVLVLGATGKTGRRLVPRLRLHGLEVRAGSRSRSNATRFDWGNPAGWDAALQGVSAAYVIAPSVPGPVHDFVARAHSAGVRRVVLLSGHGADSWGDSKFGLDMRSAEDAVRGSRLEWTVLRASNFSQNFDEENFHAPLVAGQLALPAGDVPEPFIDAEDVAEVAAAVLTQPERHHGRVYELTGPRSLTFAEAVALISKACGLPITYRQISSAAYTATLVSQGLSATAAHHVTEMFTMMEKGTISSTTQDVSAVLGHPARTFEDFVLRGAAAGAWGR